MRNTGRDESEGSERGPTTSIEEIGPAGATERFPIVGVGASAGGLEPFREIIESLPANPGFGLVIIWHLSPQHDSKLADILSRSTSMPVIQVTDEPEVEINTIYVIPPDRDMIIEKGKLILKPRELENGLHLPIDTFFRSLAEDLTHRAIGVVLSGTGKDGTLGLEAIKAAGGITLAQDESAQHGSMPGNAAGAGVVDYILSPREIAEELIRVGHHPAIGRSSHYLDGEEGALSHILHLLREKSGVDFQDYRPSTLMRRISRRMFLSKHEKLSEYAEFLESQPKELANLYQDILISVTSFFRDPGAYVALAEKVFPNLLKSYNHPEPLRIWVMGCSTGEEAYSLGIALTEFASQNGSAAQIQIFATDLNDAGIAKARQGLYPKTIEADVSRARLDRFFIETPEGYQVTKSLREMCVFAKQNVLADPPFSRVDFISCRNLLIYFEPVLQRRILPLFHFALNTHGYLWLGSSETVGTYGDFFAAVDSKHRIFSKRAHKSLPTNFTQSHEYRAPRISERTATPLRGQTLGDANREADRVLLSRFSPASVLITADMEILQYRGNTGPYLAPSPGMPSSSLMKMARPEIIVPLRALLQHVIHERSNAQRTKIEVATGNSIKVVDIEVIPVRNPPGGFNYLVVFDEVSSREHMGELMPGISPSEEEVAASDRINLLTQELTATREFLQSLIEQQEAANEELQSANEEIQSSNEELQSVNEELQTSKEEIQAANEELTTVNEEMWLRNEQLDAVNTDLNNVLANIQEPVVILNKEGFIRRFTPQAEKQLNLITGDIGKPLHEVNLPLRIDELDRRIQEVITAAQSHQVEAADRNGRWFSVRINPYKNSDNKIDGVVLVVVDIDRQKKLVKVAEKDKHRAELILANVPNCLIVLDANMVVQRASRTFYETFKVSPEETIGLPLEELGNGQWRVPALHAILRQLLESDSPFSNFEITHDFERLGPQSVLLSASQLDAETAGELLILLSIQIITDSVKARSILVEADKNKNEFLAMLAHELRNPLAAISHGVDVCSMKVNGNDPEEILIMRRQMKKLGRLVDDLLDVSRISRGVIELKNERVDLVQCARNTIDASQHGIEEKGIHLKLNLPDKPVYIVGDFIRMQQVMGNIVRNAIRYTPTGGEIEVKIQEHPDANYVELKVKDNGIGIPGRSLEEIFEMFVQLGNPLSRESESQGIGLALVRHIVELHKGTVRALSEGEGKGAEFVVTLPTGPDQTVPSTNMPQEVSESSAFSALIIDDNDDLGMLLVQILNLHNCKATFTNSGEEGIKMAGASKFDAILVDLAMPGMDGFQVMKGLQGLPNRDEFIVIAVTGYGGQEMRERALAAGAVEVMVKPIDTSKLTSIIAQHLPKRPASG